MKPFPIEKSLLPGGIFLSLDMNFIHPLFLFALTALAIPIIIHLFNFRKFKKVYFTNVRFLAEIQSETKKQSTIKQWLILAARLLAIAALVIAFAQPFIPTSPQQKKAGTQNTVSVYIDNSLSMESLSTNGTLLEIAKSKALEIAAAYSPSDLFQLLTNDFEGRHQRFVSLDEFRSLVDEVRFSSSTRKLSEVVSRQNELLSESRNVTRDAYILSDFQKSTANLQGIVPDTSITLYLIQLKADMRDNLYIDTLFFASPTHQPGQPALLTVRFRNASDKGFEKIPVKLHINNVQKAIASFNIEPNSFIEVLLPYTENSAGIQYGVLEISDYPVIYDNKFYFAYKVLPTIPVLSISGNGEDLFLKVLFQSDSVFSYRNVSDKKLDYSSFNQYSLIILNKLQDIPSGLADELFRFIQNGGSIVIFPEEKININSYNQFLSSLNCPMLESKDTLKQRVSELNLNSDVFQDVFEKNSSGQVVLPDNIDLPTVFRHYTLTKQTRNATEVIIKLQNDYPFLIQTIAGKGKLYLFTASLDESWSNFAKHVLFVPIMFKLALLSEPVQYLYRTIGNDDPISIFTDSISEKNPYKIKKTDSPYEFIPEAKTVKSNILLITHNKITEAGFYALLSGKKIIMGLGYNYNPLESNLQPLSSSEINDYLRRSLYKNSRLIQDKKTSLTHQIQQLNQGKPIWKWFLVLTLFFIAMEITLIRLIKQ